MFILCTLIVATAIVTIGYFVLFAARRSEGGLARFGRALAIWLFILAALPVLGGVGMAVTGHHPMGKGMYGFMGGKHPGYHGMWRGKMREHWDDCMREQIEKMEKMQGEEPGEKE